MLFTFSTPVLIRHLSQLKAVVFLRRCLMHAVLLEPLYMLHSRGRVVALLANVRVVLSTPKVYLSQTYLKPDPVT